MSQKSVVTLVLLCLFSGTLFAQGVPAQRVDFSDNWGTPGYSVVSQSAAGMEIVYSVPYLTFDQVPANGKTYTSVGLPGAPLFNNEGAPNLPGVSRFIAYPQGANYSFQIVESRSRVYENVIVLPAPAVPLGTDDSPLSYNEDPAIYGVDAEYPASPVLLSDPRKMRGVDVFNLGITPFAYNPVTKKLTVYSDLRIRLSFNDGNGRFGDNAYRSRWFEPMLKQNLLNYPSLPAVDFNSVPKSRGTDAGEECEYMIFIPGNKPEFLTWAEKIKDFRIKQGISTGIFDISNYGSTASGIEAKINDAYANWTIKPVAVLMLGDKPVMPVRTWNSYCMSDTLYADIDGDDLPELNIARITANNNAELELMIDKFIDYETTPPTAANYYDEPVIAGGWQTERWFVLCCEVVYGFLVNEQGKNPVREYANYSGWPSSIWSTATNTSTVVNYFGPNGLKYIPSTPTGLLMNATAARINNDLNSGAFMMLHRDHGGQTGWGEPDYDIGDLANLTNTDLCFVMSINCLTGKYDHSPECFAEAFHRLEKNNNPVGALGVIAASEISYSFVNDTFVWGAIDSLYPNFDPGYGGSTGAHPLLPGFAHASGKWYLEASNWPYNSGSKDTTYHLFHLHGDAFMQLYDEVPQNLTVSHASSIDTNATSFVVTADAGSLIALSAHDRVLGTATGTGSALSITIDPPMLAGTMYVTVTEPNHYRYEAQVAIQTSGPLAIWLPNGHLGSTLPGPEADVDVQIMDGQQSYVPGSGKVHYRFNPGDSFSSAALTPLGGEFYNANIPGARPDSLPEFYVSADHTGGGTVYSPTDAPNTTYTYTVDGLPNLMFHDDFEGDQGWTVKDTNISTGTWQRCVPNTTSGGQVAPTTDNPAGTGTYCFVTANGPPGGSYSDYDIDGGPTVLTSPVIDLTSGDATIEVCAWYYSRDGDDPFKLEISNNGGVSWTQIMSTNQSLSGWESISFLVSDYVSPTANVQVRFSAQDQPNNDIVEAGVDDFMVMRIITDASCWVGAYSLSAPSGCDIPIYLDAGAAYAGRAYAVALGLSGSNPGTPLPGGKTLPVNWDWLSTLVLNYPGLPVFDGFRGNLDSQGEAIANFRLLGPAAAPYVGQKLTVAFTLTGTFDFVSNPVSIDIEP
jgi:hypothetical protein